MKKPNAFIFIGRSGCGKGTQVELFINSLNEDSENCRTVEVESGDLLRGFAKGNSFSQTKCREIMSRGGLIPEFMVIGLWANKLTTDLTGCENIVCDGAPRKINEAKVLDSAVKFYEFEKPVVLFIEVSRDWSKKRLLARKRADDTEQDIENRLDWFDSDVAPVLEYYKSNPTYNYLTINGEQSIEDVHKEIMEKLGL
ncbi:MAG: nucleoside monophosphate kinase [Minisyncoccia bacterium]